MRIAAAVLSVVFAGSYISCVVRSELDTYIAKEKEDISVEESDKSIEHITTVTTTAPKETEITKGKESTGVTTNSDVTTVATSVTTITGTSAETSTSATTVSATSSVTTTTAITTTTVQTTTVTTTATTAEQTTIPVVTEPPVVSLGYDYSSPVPQSSVYGDDYFEKCAFLGDSHINGLGGYEIVDKKRVFAKNGISLAHINENIDISSVASIAPENVYIMMGTNGVMWTDKDTMIEMYEEFVLSLKKSLPSANIYIMGIPPVTAERESRADVASGKYLNSDINSYNSKLLDMASRNNWYYLDVCPGIKDSNGHLSSSTDGVHMSKNLYSTFKEYILNHVVE